MTKQDLVHSLSGISYNPEVYVVLPDGLRIKLHTVDIGKKEILLHTTITSVYDNQPPPEKKDEIITSS